MYTQIHKVMFASGILARLRLHCKLHQPEGGSLTQAPGLLLKFPRVLVQRRRDATQLGEHVRQ